MYITKFLKPGVLFAGRQRSNLSSIKPKGRLHDGCAEGDVGTTRQLLTRLRCTAGQKHDSHLTQGILHIWLS